MSHSHTEKRSRTSDRTGDEIREMHRDPNQRNRAGRTELEEPIRGTEPEEANQKN